MTAMTEIPDEPDCLHNNFQHNLRLKYGHLKCRMFRDVITELAGPSDRDVAIEWVR